MYLKYHSWCTLQREWESDHVYLHPKISSKIRAKFGGNKCGSYINYQKTFCCNESFLENCTSAIINNHDLQFCKIMYEINIIITTFLTYTVQTNVGFFLYGTDIWHNWQYWSDTNPRLYYKVNTQPVLIENMEKDRRWHEESSIFLWDGLMLFMYYMCDSLWEGCYWITRFISLWFLIVWTSEI